jgi:UDP-glucose 4-epimerase
LYTSPSRRPLLHAKSPGLRRQQPHGIYQHFISLPHSQIEHLVFASSSSVYGTNTKVPFAVSDNVDRPISLYAATKKAKELMAHFYSDLYNLSITGLRFFTVDLLHKSLLDTKTADVRQINTD